MHWACGELWSARLILCARVPLSSVVAGENEERWEIDDAIARKRTALRLDVVMRPQVYLQRAKYTVVHALCERGSLQVESPYSTSCNQRLSNSLVYPGRCH